ncbi:YdeI family protein [Bacteroidota bacterium]
MSDPEIYLPNREEWRSWLEKNHETEEKIWLIYYKKHTGKPSIPYNDAVEEALCFGWIDSLIRRLDDERYMQKYTPRKPKSTWSKHNVRRVEKMIAEGKMTNRGMELYEYAIDKGLLPDMDEDQKSKGLFPELPDYLVEALRDNPKAEKTFNSLSASYKLQYLGWIMDAKKEETRNKRMREAFELLESGKKLGMK